MRRLQAELEVSVQYVYMYQICINLNVYGLYTVCYESVLEIVDYSIKVPLIHLLKRVGHASTL